MKNVFFALVASLSDDIHENPWASGLIFSLRYYVHKIINPLVSINLPEQFYFTSSKALRYNRQNINIIDKKDTTFIAVA